MNAREFILHVHELTGLPEEKAEEGALVVMTLLSHRLTEDEAKDVSAQLPRDLKGFWEGNTWITSFLTITGKRMIKYKKKEELYSLVENELKRRAISISPENLVNAVFHTLKEQISEGEQEDIASQLPPRIRELWAVA